MQKDLFYFNYICVCGCVYMSTSIEVSDSHGAGVTGDCKLPVMNDEN